MIRKWKDSKNEIDENWVVISVGVDLRTILFTSDVCHTIFIEDQVRVDLPIICL